MLFTFKWMDNLQYIEQHQIIKNCLLFFIFNFTCCKVDQPPSGFSSWGDQDIPLNEGTGEGEGLPASCKVWTFPFCWIKISHTGNFCWIKISHTGKFHILGKKNVTKLLQPPGADCSPFPWNFMGNPGDEEKSYPTTKNLLICPIRKIPLNRFKSFTVKSFTSSPHQTAIFNFAIFICSCSHFYCIF